jgi:hypothetical protein
MIKNSKIWFASSILAMLSACSFRQTPFAVMPVGPPPHEEVQDSKAGYLDVYSQYSAWGTRGETMQAVTHRSDYHLQSEDGKLSQEIRNHTDEWDEGPRRIALAPGSYRIEAKAGRIGEVIVPVIIKQHETTIVHLDGYRPASTKLPLSTNLVKLPDGDVVGFSALEP